MIYLTMGDPFSVNVELVLKSLAEIRLGNPVCVIGDFEQFKMQAKSLSMEVPQFEVIDQVGPDFVSGERSLFLDLKSGRNDLADKWDARSQGAVALSTLRQIERLKSDQKFAVVTAPISKKSMSLAGFDFPGHTEYFQHIWKESAVMLLASDVLKVGLVTNHMPLNQVSQHLTSEMIVNKARKLQSTLQSVYGIKQPRIAVTGLNPHCSDGGLFGDEEQEIIEPALGLLQSEGVEVTGPLPADTVFYYAMQKKFDAVLAMYHDQGLGPFKTVAFDTGVNISGGLPHFRVSPDHGPAQNLFLKKQASPRSMIEALRVADSYLSNLN